MSFPPATEMFQFAGFASRTYGFSSGYPQGSLPKGGLPHSEIPGSTIARISPGLFAACHVLPRLSVPRHPPDALTLRLILKNAAAHRSKTPAAALRSPPRTKAKSPRRAAPKLPLHPSINTPPSRAPKQPPQATAQGAQWR